MDFVTIMDNMFFRLDLQLFNRKMNYLKLMYKLRSNQAFLVIMVLDNQDTREFIVSEIKKYIPNLCCYNIGSNEFNLKEFNERVKIVPVAISNLDNFFKKLSNDKNISLYEARDLFYQSINLCRDSLFLKYNSIFLLFVNELEFNHFIYTSDDFYSYCQCKLNFNECFINNNNYSLDEYYKEKHFRKILK